MKTNFLLVICVLVYGCSAKLATLPTKVPAADDSFFAITPELVEGQNLYQNNCASCHKLYDKSAYNTTDWKPILLKMQKKANIDDATREKIYLYLTL